MPLAIFSILLNIQKLLKQFYRVKEYADAKIYYFANHKLITLVIENFVNILKITKIILYHIGIKMILKN